VVPVIKPSGIVVALGSCPAGLSGAKGQDEAMLHLPPEP